MKPYKIIKSKKYFQKKIKLINKLQSKKIPLWFFAKSQKYIKMEFSYDSKEYD